MTVAVEPEIKTFPGKPSTLVELLRYAMDNHQRPDAFSYKQGGKWVSQTYQDVGKRVRNAALGLHKLGVSHGDRVGLLAESSVNWIVGDLGALSTGAADVPIYPTLTGKQAAYIIN